MNYFNSSSNFSSKTSSDLASLVLSVLFLLCAYAIHGQTQVSGQVIDKTGLGLPGVNIFIEGTYTGTSSDIDGNFSFTCQKTGEQNLVATFIGMDTFRYTILLKGENIQLPINMNTSSTALEEIVVSAGMIEASGDKKRAAALSPMDIVLVASASADIAGALNLLPGTTRNGETGEVLVRGGAGYETKTYIDGLLVDQPYNSTVGNVAARNRFSPFMFKGTSFSTGGYGAEYGQAMSSALLLHTSDLAPETSTGLMLLSVGGSLSHTQRWDKQSLSVTGEITDLSPYFSIMPQDRTWTNAPTSQGLQVNYKQEISDQGGLFKFYSNITRSSMSLIHESVNRELTLDNDYLYINSSITDVKGDWLLFGGIAASKSDDKVSSEWQNATGFSSFQSRFTAQRDLGSNFRFKGGLEQVAGKYSDSFVQSNGEQGPYFWIKDVLGAGFAQLDFKLSDRIVGRFGGRYEYSTMTQNTNIAPRLSLSYKLAKGEQFSLAYGDYYQKPEYQELRRTRNLSSEKATHLLANYQKVSKDYVFRVEAYQKWYNDLIKYGDYESTNTGSGYARGIDFFFRDNKSLKNGDYWITYSYLDTKRDWKDFPVEANPDFAMNHSLAIAYKQFFPAINTSFSTSYSFNSGRPYFDPTLSAEDFNASRTPNYHDLSSTVTYLTNVGGNFTVFYLSVTNVLGLNQTFGYDYTSNADGSYQKNAINPAAKRMAVMAVVMNFGESYDKETVTSDDY